MMNNGAGCCHTPCALRPVQAAVATLGLMFALGLWAHYADMARRDYQILNEWTETKAAVLSRRLDASSGSSSSRSSTSRRDSSRYKPELALSYQVEATIILSTGYGSGSALRRGGFEVRPIRGAAIPSRSVAYAPLGKTTPGRGAIRSGLARKTVDEGCQMPTVKIVGMSYK